ncbi:MAG: DUF3109 family protein [Bacteroidia bacterium]|nr:DUF3109 family protein [Bacteroidia bacterium]
MIQIEDKLVSGEVLDELFACDILRCKGACCVEGDLGAPLEDDELSILAEIFDQVEPFLRPEGKRAIAEQGTSVADFTGGYSTPLVNDRECAYVTYTPDRIALCGIEQAYEAGKINFRKPISCHLYPIRISQSRYHEVLNYDRWDICAAACVKGKNNGIRVFEFVKDALIRKYGEDFFASLKAVAENEHKP